MNGFFVDRSGMIALAAVFFAGTAAQANDFNVNKVMAADGTLLLSHFADVNADCSSRGAIEVRVLSGPSSGSIRVVPQAYYAHFAGDYAQCSTNKVSGKSVYYTPQRGFIGSDSVQIDVFFPAGAESTGIFTITVK